MYGNPIFVFDVNGHKGPNKWGYDIFLFQIIGNKQDGMTKLESINYATDKGGKNFCSNAAKFLILFHLVIALCYKICLWYNFSV